MEMTDVEDFIVHEHDGLRLVDLYLEFHPFAWVFSVKFANIAEWLVFGCDHEIDFAVVLPPPKDVEHGARFISQAEAYLGDAEKACLEFNDMAWTQMLFEYKRFGRVHAAQIDMRLLDVRRHARPSFHTVFFPKRK